MDDVIRRDQGGSESYPMLSGFGWSEKGEGTATSHVAEITIEADPADAPIGVTGLAIVEHDRIIRVGHQQWPCRKMPTVPVIRSWGERLRLLEIGRASCRERVCQYV